MTQNLSNVVWTLYTIQHTISRCVLPGLRLYIYKQATCTDIRPGEGGGGGGAYIQIIQYIYCPYVKWP